MDGQEKQRRSSHRIFLSVVRQKAVHRCTDARIACKLDEPSMLVLFRLGKELLIHGERQAPVIKLAVDAHLPNKALGREKDVTRALVLVEGHIGAERTHIVEKDARVIARVRRISILLETEFVHDVEPG